jgi:hypothetical protein
LIEAPWGVCIFVVRVIPTTERLTRNANVR